MGIMERIRLGQEKRERHQFINNVVDELLEQKDLSAQIYYLEKLSEAGKLSDDEYDVLSTLVSKKWLHKYPRKTLEKLW